MKPSTLILTSLLLSGLAAAQTTPDTERTITDQQVTSAGAPLTTLTVTLPERVKQAQFTLPLRSGVTSVQIGTQTYVPTTVGEQLLWTVPAPADILTLILDAPVTAEDLGVAVQYDTGLTERLAGPTDFKAGAAAGASSGNVTLRDGVIQYPSTGPAARGRSSTNVTTISRLDEPFTLLVNGQAVPDKLIGRRVDNSGTGFTTRDYIAVPLQPGVNTITAVTPDGEDTVSVTVAGVAASARVLSSALLADGFTPLTVTLDITDAQGRPTVVPTVTLTDTGSLTLTTPDGDPAQAGHQLRVVNGQTSMTFAPTSTPGPQQVALDVNNHPVILNLNVTAANRRNVVTLISTTISGLGQNPEVTDIAARATVEAPIIGGQLTALVDTSGAHTDTPAEVRFPGLGDTSRETRPLQADGPIAARFDHPNVTATYARNAATDPVFGAPALGDALNVTTKGRTQVHAYAAPFAGSILEVPVTLNGTRLTQLPERLDPARVQLTLRVTREGLTTDTVLTRGRDYVIDAQGLITFTRPLFPTPDVDTRQVLIARGPTSVREISPQAQLAVTHTATNGELTGTAAAGVHANLASEPANVTYGVRYKAADTTGPRTLSVDARAAFNATGLRGEFIAEAASPSGRVTVAAAHETPDFTGYTATGTPGGVITVTAQAPVTRTFGVQVSARAQTSATSFGVRASAGLAYTPNQMSEYTAGVFTGVGDLSGTGVTAGARWSAGPWTTTLTAQQQLSRTDGQYSAQVTRKVPLPERLPPGTELAIGAKVTGIRTNGDFTVRARTVLEGRAGPYTAALEYGLPTVTDQNGELRGSVTATLPVTDRVNVGGTFTLAPGIRTLTSDVRYTSPNAVTTTGLDLSHDDKNGASASARFSVSYAGERTRTPWGVTADGLSTFSRAGAGHRYALGATYRGEQWNAAAYLRLRAGQYAAEKTGMDLTAEANVTYNPGRGDVRLGLAAQAKSTDPGHATVQGVLAGRYWFTQDLALGAAYRGLYTQAGLGASAYAIEGSWRFTTPAMLTLGYNVGGFTPITTEPTRPGAYLRLDFLLDDTDHRDP